MDETIQRYLLGMEDLPLRVEFKEELYSIIPTFHNDHAVVLFRPETIPGGEMFQHQMAPIPGSTGSGDQRFPIIQSNTVIVGEHSEIMSPVL